MKQALLAPPLPSSLDTASAQYVQNRADMLEQLAVIDDLLDQAEAGGGPKRMERLRSRGKLPVRERIANVLDPDSPFLEISPLAAYDSDYTIGGGMVVGIGVIAGTECVIIANDPSVLGGALTPYAAKKWTRALEMARDNRMPYVSFVESAGADLRVETDGGGRRVQTFHFAESGRFFYDLIDLSKLRIPTVCEESDDEMLGGAKMHAEVSGLGDYFAEDEMDALRMCREVVSHLNWRKAGPDAALRSDDPAHDPEELIGLVSRDLRQPVDVRDVVARVVDGSRFEEFKARYGSTIVCGWATIHGYPVGIVGNNGVIYPRAAEKAAHFIQLCNQIDVPLVFLQNVTGYMVGRDFEAEGIIKKGSQMLNAVTNSTVPHLTVIIGSSYGAGTYGMSGRAFGNRFTFLWPTAKIAVMGPKQIAGVMSLVRRGQAARKGLEFDEEEDRQIVEMVEAIQEQGSLALVATGAISDDGIVDPRDTRTVLGLCLSVVRNRPVEGTEGYGVFRL